MDKEGMKQKVLAAEMGMSDSNLSRILARVSSPSHDQLIYISDRFGVSLNWLMRGIGPETLTDAEGEYSAERSTLEQIAAEIKRQGEEIEKLWQLQASAENRNTRLNNGD